MNDDASLSVFAVYDLSLKSSIACAWMVGFALAIILTNWCALDPLIVSCYHELTDVPSEARSQSKI